MKPTAVPKIDLKQSCALYSGTIQRTLQDLFAIEVANEASAESVTQLKDQEDLYFSILFTGQVYGEFLIGLNKKTALKMLGIECQPGDEERTYWANRKDILDSFKEVANIAAGTTLGQFKLVFPDLSITPPKSIEGNITLSAYKIEMAQLKHASGNLSCYIYIDYMKLEVRSSIEKSTKSLSLEKEKQDELKRLNRAKSEFLANMSHELRTPLNGMIGMLDILKMSTLNQIQKEQFDIIYRSGEFLLSLISDILEFSKIESGKMEIERKPFDLRDSIESVAENLATVVYQKGLDFNVQIASEISGEYVGDQTRLKQVLVNLIGNAIKFTPTGSITVTAQALANQRISICVADTGIGIPAGKLETIFASFSQVDVSDNRKYGGTGLGLSISKTIVTAMGGDLRVQSEEAKGCQFTIEIPLESSPEAKPQPLIAEGFRGAVFLQTDDSFMFDSMKSTVQSLNTGAELKVGDHSDLSMLVAGDLFFVDFKSWQTMTSDQIGRLVSAVQAREVRLVFVTLPRDLALLEAIQTEHNLKGISHLNLPVTRSRLASALQTPAEQNFCRLDLAPAAKSLDANNSALTLPRVLVVEDNQVNQIVITTMLKKLGYEVQVANDGLQAVQLVEGGEHFDLILMDCQMPVMNGYDATLAIRRIEEQIHRHAPIIALTANAFRETKEACFECGMDDFATKPIKFETLKEVIKNSMKKVSS